MKAMTSVSRSGRVRLLLEAGSMLLVLAAGCGSVQWEYDLQRGFQKSVERQRPVLLQFFSPLSSECIAMDDEVFSDPEIQEQLEQYVCVRLDYQLNRDLARQLGVESVPAFFVFRSDRSLAGSHAGRMDTGRFKFFLIKYRYF